MLVRFDQFRDYDRLADQFDQVWRRPSSTVAMDAYRHGNEVTIDLDLPGMDPDAIELTVERDSTELTRTISRLASGTTMRTTRSSPPSDRTAPTPAACSWATASTAPTSKRPTTTVCSP